MSKWIGAWTTLLVVSLSLVSCAEPDTRYQARVQDAALFNEAMQQLTDVIVQDIFSPPVASRIYAYPTVAAYSIMQQAFPEKYLSLEGQLTDFTAIPEIPQGVNPHLAATHAFLLLGENFIFSKKRMSDYREKLYAELRELGMPDSEFQAATAYADMVVAHIKGWAGEDFYKQTRSFPKYAIQEQDQFWKPTPPDYMEGIEPHWKSIRPLVIPRADAFDPKAPLEIDMSPNSPFYAQLMEVYEKGKKVTQKNDENEEARIAAFWDCNPYVSNYKGHAMFAVKKITPGGHWMGITKIASQKAGSSYDETIEAYLYVTAALFDGFISCWDTKWKTLVVRPETLIHQYVDEEWRPKLQTPPFPEYTSGHSVISSAAALALTKIYGDEFDFVDTTEEKFGIPARSFSSFVQASQEAAISRLYGGIHYRMAIEQGIIQGRAVGDYVTTHLNTRAEQAPQAVAVNE